MDKLKLRPVLCAVLLMLMGVTGCTKRLDVPEGQGAVSLSLAMDQSETEMILSRSLPTIDPYKDLAIHVENTKGDTLIRWACFDDMPEILYFTPGAYMLVAQYGGAKLPAFDTYTYRAEEKFVVANGEHLNIALVAKLATTKVTVEFDDSFDFYYLKYSVDIRTSTADSLRFEPGEGRAGFFEPGNIRMRFNLMTKEGQELTFSPSPIASAKAAEFYKLTLKVNSDAGTSQVIVIGTDDSTEDHEIEIEVPQYFLPKDAPTFDNLTGFTNGVRQEIYEGEIPQWTLSATVPGGISQFILRIADPGSALARRLGTDVVDIASLSADDPLRQTLKSAGFAWSEALNDPETASYSTSLFFDFTNAMVADGGQDTEYKFSIELADPYAQTPADNPCTVEALIKVPTVNLTAEAGRIWTTTGEFLVEADYDMTSGTRPVLQFRRAGNPGWNNAIAGDDLEITDQGLTGSLYTALYTLRGLQPATKYEFRIQLNGAPGTEYAFRTEELLQLPNSDFETFTTVDKFPYDGSVTEYRWTGGWMTRNALTTSQQEYSMSATESTYNSTVLETAVTAVSSASHVAPVENPLDYSNAIKLQTSGWGRGSYSNNITQAAGNRITGGGSPNLSARVRNLSAGVLFLGEYSYNALVSQTESWNYYSGTLTSRSITYSYDNFTSETLTESGLAFGSRPTALTFQYAFTPIGDGADPFLVRAVLYGESGGSEVEIARLEWQDDTETSMTEVTRSFVYDPVYRYVRATRLAVFFSSDTDYEVKASPADTDTPSFVKRTDGNPHVGNTLILDNLKLEYDL